MISFSKWDGDEVMFVTTQTGSDLFVDIVANDNLTIEVHGCYRPYRIVDRQG